MTVLQNFHSICDATQTSTNQVYLQIKLVAKPLAGAQNVKKICEIEHFILLKCLRTSLIYY